MQEVIDRWSGGLRLLIVLIGSVVGIMTFLYDIKTDIRDVDHTHKIIIEQLRGELRNYHTMVATLSEENDELYKRFVGHVEDDGHREMKIRMDSVERQLDRNSMNGE